MTFVDAGPYKFTYNNDESFETNFNVWSQLNTEERIAFMKNLIQGKSN